MIRMNGQMIDVTQFPDQTSQVWKIPHEVLNPNEADIEWDFSDESEFLHLAQLKCLLDSLDKTSTLRICYLPYARQDKPVSNDSTFALRPFAVLLNALNFNKVLIDDPHSHLAIELIQKSEALYPTETVRKIIAATRTDLLCYPDKGARTRYSTIYAQPSIYGEKVRDQISGQITSYELIGNPEGKNILIVDDICDGGATFIALAKQLIQHKAASVNLFVTHGLFTKGLRPLEEAGIQNIFCRKGKATQNKDRIQYMEIEK